MTCLEVKDCYNIITPAGGTFTLKFFSHIPIPNLLTKSDGDFLFATPLRLFYDRSNLG